MNKDILKEIGLTNYEAEIYLALLSSGQISAYSLAEKAGLYRQVTYDSLKRLVEKGYVSSVIEGKKKLFRATDPNLILEYLHEKTENYKQILPDLTKLSLEAKEPISVETYKGSNVIRIALRDIINQLKETNNLIVLCTAVDETLPWKKNKTVLEQYERDLLKHNIKEKIIVREGDFGLFKKGTSKYKQIPEKYFNPNPTQIYGDTVSIAVFGNPDHLIIIRSKVVADSYRKQFELLWKNAKPVLKK